MLFHSCTYRLCVIFDFVYILNGATLAGLSRPSSDSMLSVGQFGCCHVTSPTVLLQPTPLITSNKVVMLSPADLHIHVYKMCAKNETCVIFNI